MKKLVLGLFLFLLPFSVCEPAAGPEDAAFLRKINALYYCLSCEGLKNFQCSIQPDVREWGKQHLGSDEGAKIIGSAFLNTTYTLKDKKAGGVSVDILAGASGPYLNSKAKALSRDFGKRIKAALGLWDNFTMSPFFSEKDIKTNDFVILKSQDGFSVKITDHHLTTTYFFDKESALTSFATVGENGVTWNYKTEFKKTSKGFALVFLSYKYQEATIDLTFDYSDFEDFMFPENMTIITTGEDGTLLMTTYKLSKYATNH